MDRKKYEPRNKRSIIERLRAMKETDERNKKRMEEFKKQQERNKKLFDMYVNGIISREEFESRYKK